MSSEPGKKSLAVKRLQPVITDTKKPGFCRASSVDGLDKQFGVLVAAAVRAGEDEDY